MARIGLKTTLTYWLESPKTYHSPINLRFTWPIELTKTYSHDDDIINLLGDRPHGFVCRLVDEDNPTGWSLFIHIFRQGRQIYKFSRYAGDEPSYKIRIKDMYVSAPEILYVQDYVIKGNVVPIYVKMVRRWKVVMEMNDPTSVDTFTMYRYGLHDGSNGMPPLSYHAMIAELVHLSG